MGCRHGQWHLSPMPDTFLKHLLNASLLASVSPHTGDPRQASRLPASHLPCQGHCPCCKGWGAGHCPWNKLHPENHRSSPTPSAHSSDKQRVMLPSSGTLAERRAGEHGHGPTHTHTGESTPSPKFTGRSLPHPAHPAPTTRSRTLGPVIRQAQYHCAHSQIRGLGRREVRPAA